MNKPSSTPTSPGFKEVRKYLRSSQQRETSVVSSVPVGLPLNSASSPGPSPQTFVDKFTLHWTKVFDMPASEPPYPGASWLTPINNPLLHHLKISLVAGVFFNHQPLRQDHGRRGVLRYPSRA